jgi:hypothetical protein
VALSSTGPPVQIPKDVLDVLSRIFGDCNTKVAGTLSRVPMTREDALDQILISHLDETGPEAAPSSGWIVDIETHFLGGGHHQFGWIGGFRRPWEIADIGVLVVLRRGKTIVWSKVALLQSKRLFPLTAKHDAEAEQKRFRWGFGRLRESYEPWYGRREFEFGELSRYESLNLFDDQATHIESYQTEMMLPVHYLLYNPVQIPWKRTLPTTSSSSSLPTNDIGCRVLRVEQILSLRSAKVKIPSYQNISGLLPPHAAAPFLAGWRLEDFVVSLLLGCIEGKVLDDSSLDNAMELLFYRRTGPIAAAFAVNIELPE